MRHLGISCILVNTGRTGGVIFSVGLFSLHSNRKQSVVVDLFIYHTLTTWTVTSGHLTSFSARHLNSVSLRPWPARSLVCRRQEQCLLWRSFLCRLYERLLLFFLRDISDSKISEIFTSHIGWQEEGTHMCRSNPGGTGIRSLGDLIRWVLTVGNLAGWCTENFM